MDETQATEQHPLPPELPLLMRLALMLVLREVKKHPHTLAVGALNVLTGESCLDCALGSAPWLFRQAVRLVASEVHRRPHTLLAHAVREIGEFGRGGARGAGRGRPEQPWVTRSTPRRHRTRCSGTWMPR
jgi:hypothetical protein